MNTSDQGPPGARTLGRLIMKMSFQAAVVAALALGAVTLASAQQAPTDPGAVARLQDQIDQLKEQVAALRAQLEALSRASQPQPQASPAAQEPAAQEPAAPAPLPPAATVSSTPR